LICSAARALVTDNCRLSLGPKAPGNLPLAGAEATFTL
jgi:hypothetical protein